MDHGNPSIDAARVLFVSDEHVTFVPESRVSSYQTMPESRLWRDCALSGSRPAARGSLRCTYSAACFVRSDSCTSTSSPGRSTAPSTSGRSTRTFLKGTSAGGDCPAR